MNTFLNKLLDYYEISEKEFANLSKPLNEIKLLDPDSIKGMKKAKERINKAINNKEKIIIYGDYDCDGISATSIMVKTFEKLNYEVSYYIPSRYIDGYGLNVENVLKIKEKNFSLIITVDNGISQFDAIKKAKELGIDVIVVDHHEVPSERVEALAILHPIVSEISSIIASGGYMSLFLSAALLGYYDDYLVTIAGLSVISDMMELVGYNRDVVRLAIYNLETKKYPSLYLLLEDKNISEKSFGLDIAPKINAVGRLVNDKSVNLLVKFLTSNNQEEIYKLHTWIISINERRKELTKSAVESLNIDQNLDAGIILNLNLKEGLLGLIANRILNEYNLPTIIFTADEKNPEILKGSARSKDGFNIVKCFESLNKYLLTGGGHSFAGGLSIKKDDFPSFEKDFLELCRNYPIKKIQEKYIEINILDINFENYEIIKEFSPFGMSFNEPLFCISSLPTRSLTFISQGKHLSTSLTINSKILGFNMNQDKIKSHPFINLYGHYLLTTFRNNKTLEFRVSNFETIEELK